MVIADPTKNTADYLLSAAQREQARLQLAENDRSQSEET